MGRVLSIDYGVRRTGLAVTDPLQLIAGGLTTVETPRLMAFLQDYVRREPVERFVVGLPKQTNGRDSDNLPRVRSFVGQLKKMFPGKTCRYLVSLDIYTHYSLPDGATQQSTRGRNQRHYHSAGVDGGAEGLISSTSQSVLSASDFAKRLYLFLL